MKNMCLPIGDFFLCSTLLLVLSCAKPEEVHVWERGEITLEAEDKG